MATPAQQLVGLELSGGWYVESAVVRGPESTGGHFSHGYIVESTTGDRAYLKALDFQKALGNHNPIDLLHAMTEAYKYERDLCARCRTQNLDRVVMTIADGTAYTKPDDPMTAVPYLIFELAEGDIRAGLDKSRRFEAGWVLRTLHNIATGLKQLHGLGVAHQDLKPSNVLLFTGIGAKIGDLGRCVSQSSPAPHDSLDVCGDLSYAPPERRYGYADNEWRRGRLGCDAYLLGSMIYFMFMGLGMSATLYTFMRNEHRPEVWAGTFDEVLPYLRAAFAEALKAFGLYLPHKLRADILVQLKELCEPDPRERGVRGLKALSQNPVALDRYVTRLDLIARNIEIGRDGY